VSFAPDFAAFFLPEDLGFVGPPPSAAAFPFPPGAPALGDGSEGFAPADGAGFPSDLAAALGAAAGGAVPAGLGAAVTGGADGEAGVEGFGEEGGAAAATGGAGPALGAGWVAPFGGELLGAGAPPLVLAEAAARAEAALAWSAARLRECARVHFRRWPTRPRWSCCFRQEPEQKWKTVPSRLTNIAPVPGSMSPAQNEHCRLTTIDGS
jgi:hypothetical protein